MMRVLLVLLLLAIGPSVDAFGLPKAVKTTSFSDPCSLSPSQRPGASKLYLRGNNKNNEESDGLEPEILPRMAAFSGAFCLATVLWFAGGCHSAVAAAAENDYLSITETDIAIQSNKKLIDYAVGTVNTQFYDNSGGARFNPSDFYRQWKDVQKTLVEETNDPTTKQQQQQQQLRLDTREGTVDTLRYLIGSLKDPYSKYMTREELRYELKGSHDGFLGTGAYIEVPKTAASMTIAAAPTESTTRSSLQSTLAHNRNREQQTFRVNIARESLEKKTTTKSKQLLTNTKVANLPVVTAVVPNSPAERAGLVVGDRIVGVGDKDTFVGYGRDEIRKCLAKNWGYGMTSSTSSSKQYFGVADLTIAKPVYYLGTAPDDDVSSSLPPPEIVMGYRSTKVKLPTKATETTTNNDQTELRGDSVVQYELLTASRSIFGNLSPRADDVDGASVSTSTNQDENDTRVGYIRLTRFSKSSTEGYLQAVQALEDEGAGSYVIDLRNNYGGVIQEAMLTASTVIGDPHALLCYLLNARGGFTPVDVESYVVDPKYPGYLLSKEPKSIVLEQVMKERPGMFRTVKDDTAVATTDRNNNHHVDSLPLLQGQGGKRIVVDWDPPSSYASIHEQVAKRGIHRISYVNYEPTSEDAAYGSAMPNRKSNNNDNAVAYRQRQQKLLQKDIVLLINEGTASSAEFFTAALQDNGRSLAVVGTKSFGKGLIQHTFPMPDGGGLKLTIGEFLRPSLKHVTNPFWDRDSSVAGGIRPDVYCDSKQGIPGNPKADLCVGVALDVLEEAKSIKAATSSTTTANGNPARTKAVSSSTTMISGSALR